MVKNQKKVLIVGFGKRVKKYILPALSLIDGDVQLAGVVCRSKKNFQFKGKKFSTHKNFDLIDFSEIKIVIVAVTTENVPQVLKSLSTKKVGHISLFLDTPVLAINHFWAIGYLRQFKHVYASEDYIGFPELEVFRKVVESGVIGKLNKIYFFHNAYRHHGVAMAKYLTKNSTLLKIRNNNLSQSVTEQTLTLPKKVRVEIVGPKRYSSSRTLLVGEVGTMSNFPLEDENNITLNYFFDKKSEHFELQLELGSSLNKKKAKKLRSLTFSKISSKGFETIVDAQKVDSLKKTFENCLLNKKHFYYHYLDALYDRYSILIVERYGLFFDWPIFSKSSIFGLILKLGNAIFLRLPTSFINIIYSYQFND